MIPEPGSYEIGGAAANVYRAIGVARLDLEIAREMIACCVDAREDSEQEDRAEEAYWTTALVRYSRAFLDGRGVDWGHAEALARLSIEHRECNMRMRLLRDKLIAHPVGVGEDMAVTACVGQDRHQEFHVYGVTIAKSRILSMGTDEAKKFADLLDTLIPIVQAMEDCQHQLVLDDVRTWAPSAVTALGLHREQVHFDESSVLYRTAQGKYK